MRGVAEGEAALDAGMAAIGFAVLVRDHAHQLLAAHLRLEGAADAAIGAGGDDGLLGRADLDHALLVQRRGGAGLDAGAARDAFGIEERLFLRGRHHGVEAAAGDGQSECALHLFAGADAARADDAFRRLVGEIGVRGVEPGIGVAMAVIAVSHLAQAHRAGHVLQFAIAIGRAGQAVERVLGDIELHHALAEPLQSVGLGVHHHAFGDRRGAGGGRAVAALDLDQAKPAGAERVKHVGGAELGDLRAHLHRRAHDRGAFRHAQLDAVDGQRDLLLGFGGRGPVIDFLGHRHCRFLIQQLQALSCGAEILGEMRERAQHRIGGKPAKGAKRSELHGVAEIFEHDQIGRRVLACHDLVDQLYAPRRADAAGRALAAGLDGAELHGETGLLGHVDGVVEHHDAAMADQPVGCGKRLVVERRVEQLAWEIGAERTADLHGAHRAACARAAADLIDQRAERDAERRLVEPAMLDIAGKLDRHGAARLAHAEIAIMRAAFAHDDRHGGQRQHVVDDGRLAEQADMGGERRLGPDLAALAFEALEQRGLLAAHIGACAGPHFHVEIVFGARDLATEHAALARLAHGDLHRLDGVGIFGADIDVAVGRAHRDAGDGHAFDQHEGIAFHDHAVGEGA